MPEYIPKIRVAAVVTLAGEKPLRGFFSLAPHSAIRVGPESLFERLNSTDRVIPFHRGADAVVLMLARQAIECVAPGDTVDEARVCPPPVFTTAEERVRVRFQSGAALAGMLRIELPDHLNRASDFLNCPDDFFPLVTDDGIRLLNKARILDVTVFESSPLPPSAGTSGGYAAHR